MTLFAAPCHRHGCPWDMGSPTERVSVLSRDEYTRLSQQIADRDAEIERLRADLVWAVRTCCEQFDDNLIVWQTGSEELGEIVFDGTDADILRAVREARDGE